MKTTKRSTYTATHYGECQLCGHTQKLPGGGLLSLHGYEVRWNSFQGTCPGSRHKPYEQSFDLLPPEIKRQREVIESLKEDVATITSPKFKDIFVTEYVKSHGDQRSYYAQRRLKPSEYTATKTRIEWMTRQYGNQKPEKSEITNYSSTSVAAMIAHANEREVRSINANIKNREDYCVWLQQRIDGWKLKDLTPIPEELQGSGAVTLHALNAYYSKKTGRDEALCGSGSRFSGRSSYKQIAKEGQTVTCKACLKALAAQNADKAESAAADALIAEYVAKLGEGVKTRWSDLNKQAISDIRYKRKEIDKNIRKRATDRLERGA